MRNLSELKTQTRNIPVLLLVFVCANKWIFEGIMNQTVVELLLIGAGLLLLAWQCGICLESGSSVWLIYCASILFSVYTTDSTINIWGRALIMVTLTLYAVLGDHKRIDFHKVIRLLILIALVHAALIMVQYVLKDIFNNLYFPLLTENAAASAQTYFDRGYFFGVHYSPHEVAGILAFAIAALLLRSLSGHKNIRISFVLALVLMVPLLLTGKKGVLGLAVAAFVAVMTIRLICSRQWKKLAFIFAALAALGVAVLVYIWLNPDNVIFRRITQFFVKLVNGEAVGSGRDRLYHFALRAWRTNKPFGIGWYHFIGMSTTVFGYATPHHVNHDYLQWLCELGVMGFTLNMIPVLVTLYQTVYVCVKLVNQITCPNEKWVVLFAVWVQFYTLAYAFVEVPFYDIYFFAMYMLSCLIIHGVYADRNNLKGKGPLIAPRCETEDL